MINATCLQQLMALSIAIAVAFPMALANNQLTVAQGSDYSCNAPVNFIWVDTQGTQTQVIYPADSLFDMMDEPINSVTFYLREGCGSSGGSLRVSMGETTATSFGTYATGLTQVATISLTAGQTQIVVTCDTPYIYHGGNLVIETVVEETTDYSETFVRGMRTSSYSTLTRGELERFLPMATFDYGTNDDYAAKVYPAALQFNTIRAGLVDVQQLALKNIGQLPFTPTFSIAEPFAIETPSGTLEPGQTMDLSVKFQPQAMGDYASTLTIDCGQAGIFTIPLQATALMAAEYLTVCESRNYTTYLPLDGLYYDMIGTQGQMIYPAHMLTAMQGRKIMAIDFHPRRLNMSEGEITLSLKVTDSDGFAERPVLETGLTPVAVTTPVKGETMLSFVLDEPFEYNGGNLLIDAQVTVAGKKNYVMSSFYGVAMDYYPSMDVFTDDCIDYWKEAVPFLPMVTFSYSLQEQLLRGDVDQDGNVGIADVSALIDYLLSQDASTISRAAADVDQDGSVGIADASALIDYLLAGSW